MWGGRLCHILEYPGHDKLWLDSDLGCVIVAREAFDPQTGILVQRVETSNHKEIAPGLWVPFVCRNILFSSTSKGVEAGMASKKSDAILKFIDVNINESVLDKNFEFTPQPGSIQSMPDDRVQQSEPGGFEYLDVVFNWINYLRNVPAYNTSVNYSKVESFIEFVFSVISAIFLVYFFWLRKRFVPQLDS